MTNKTKHSTNTMWMQTWRGHSFFYNDLHNEDSKIIMADIVCGLARLPRCLGHGQKVLSVAEHSIIVSYIVESLGGTKKQQLYGLLHDAHETYCGDIPKPYKDYLQAIHGFNIRYVEDEFQERIYNALKIVQPDGVDSKLIKTADEYALFYERRINMKSGLKWPYIDELTPNQDYTYLFQFSPPSAAASEFVSRYEALRDPSVV